MTRPEVIGHRGAAALAPENTLASFRTALDAAVSWVEFDVRATADGHAVVIHDRTLDRTTDGRGRVRAHDLAALRRLDAGSWFAPAFAHEPIPTLVDALSALRGRAIAIVELKADDRDEAQAVVAAVVRSLSDLSRAARREVVVSSGTWTLPTAVRARVPDLRTALVVGRLESADEVARARRDRCEQLHVALPRVTGARVERARKAGIAVAAWTVRDVRVVPRVVRAGVAAVFADDPAAARAAIASCS